jgi:CNT family concentrative nucleoside transporter
MVIISICALSGFTDFSSIVIRLGGIGGAGCLPPARSSRGGLRAMVAGSPAAFMTATVTGALL